MTTRRRTTITLTAAAVGTVAALALGSVPALAAPAAASGPLSTDPTSNDPSGDRHSRIADLLQRGSTDLRIATYNLSLNRATAGELEADLSTGDDVQAQTVAEVIQRANPDIVLLNEFDYVPDGRAADLFRTNYLQVSQGGADPVEYPYAFVAPSNTGVPSGFDLNNDGTVGGGDDALGFGLFEGQYGMVVLSKFPIVTSQVRTFQNFLWKDMPGALLPDDPATPAANDWYTPEELEVVRLSSKSHWDVPVKVGRSTVHVLASHPTPPTFDGAEDRNGKRNHDEIRFWSDYVSPGKGRYIVDDQGHRGGLGITQPFVILGDQNADPVDGDSVDAAIDQLLDNRRITDPLPTSEGAVEASALQGGANATHAGDPRYDTADFADGAPGNLRADYVLPSRVLLKVQDAGVFWPVTADPLSRLTGVYPFPSSDHRLTWVDLRVPGWTGWIS
ncbi:endonuclease/exonuclease/phosphatase family protein [Agromyces aureus]|uniref:Endonuclease n=1 Tax=Agromyces aureus TaxID=453304 RepID=A0A191WD53_9MICO|nr:endonuclease/exonuclease/phosphatase family protein [Agromyces aureus]ANJ26133.1 endonuclease [Agromyces aureus]